MRRTCGRRIGDGVAREGRGRGGPCLVRSPLKMTVGVGVGARKPRLVSSELGRTGGSTLHRRICNDDGHESRRRRRVFGQPPQEIWQHRLLTRPRRPHATIGRRSRDIRTRHPRPPGPLQGHPPLAPPCVRSEKAAADGEKKSVRTERRGWLGFH